jgi:hypothetical protein
VAAAAAAAVAVVLIDSTGLVTMLEAVITTAVTAAISTLAAAAVLAAVMMRWRLCSGDADASARRRSARRMHGTDHLNACCKKHGATRDMIADLRIAIKRLCMYVFEDMKHMTSDVMTIFKYD